MIPKIGVSSKIFGFGKWYKLAQKSPFQTIEINRFFSHLNYLPVQIKKISPFLAGKDLSVHSNTKWIFTEIPQFCKTELEILKSEIILCQMIGAKELIFHLKPENLNQEETLQIKEVIKIAEKHKIQLVYESGFIIAENVLDNLKRFPELGFNLDFGHLNVGIDKGLFNYDLNQFLRKIKDRTTYLHVHNNHGQEDEHISLARGTLDWQHVLDSLDMEKIKKIIIETNLPDHAEESLQELKKYFKK